MNIFNCDLDNTLIYSYKKNIGEYKKCVEVYNGKQISFMSIKSLQLLKKVIDNICFVPTTTRSLQQYKRINFDNILPPKYALAANGGILIENNKINEQWYKDSLNMIKPCMDTFRHAYNYLKCDKNICFEIRLTDGLFLFTKSKNSEETIKNLKKHIDLNTVDIFENGVKIYVLPKILNKGNAVKRLKKKLNAKYIIAAGDSELDISMLNYSDFAFLPNNLKNKVKNKNKAVIADDENNLFSDIILDTLTQNEFISNI